MTYPGGGRDMSSHYRLLLNHSLRLIAQQILFHFHDKEFNITIVHHFNNIIFPLTNDV